MRKCSKVSRKFVDERTGDMDEGSGLLARITDLLMRESCVDGEVVKTVL